MKLTIFADGASRGNPGPAAYGFTIQEAGGNLLYKKGEYIGITTNNVAEYTAVLQALKYLLKNFFALSPLEVSVYVDSRLVASQLAGLFKIKSQNLKPLISQIKNLERALGTVKYTHIRRHLNSQADDLANQALDQKLRISGKDS